MLSDKGKRNKHWYLDWISMFRYSPSCKRLKVFQPLYRTPGRSIIVPFNRKGMTTVELMIAMLIMTLVLVSVPALMSTVNSRTRSTIEGVRESRKEHAAITSLLKDVKSSESVELSADGKTITLQRSQNENGVLYAIRDGALYRNTELLLSNVKDGSFLETGTVVSVALEMVNAEPIQLMMRRPSLKTLIDDGNQPNYPDFDEQGVQLKCNGTLINSSPKSISVPVNQVTEISLETVDPLARIVYYTSDYLSPGDSSVSDRIYVEGNSVQFQTYGVLKTVTITVKVVAEDGISMNTHTIKIVPKSSPADPVPDWMWGGDQAFRTYMARVVFKTTPANLPTVTFGAVRAYTGALDMDLYNITELGEIIGEFKGTTRISFASSWINHLPLSLCDQMQNLQVLNMRGCTKLTTECPDGSYSTFKANIQNPTWKNANCRNVVVTWP